MTSMPIECTLHIVRPSIFRMYTGKVNSRTSDPATYESFLSSCGYALSSLSFGISKSE